MAISPRTLRPRASGSVHVEAAAWKTAVVSGGGTVSASTLNAVSAFCKAIDGVSGLRGKLYRCNLFCGDSDANLVAVRTPLYRGPAPTGQQWGNATDVNSGIQTGDYTETGTGGGLNAGSAKYLLTGFQPNAAGISAYDTHMAIYSRAQITDNSVTILGGFGGGVPASTWQLLAFGSSSLLFYRSGGANSCGLESVTWSGANRSGHIMAVRSASNAAKLYRNGTDLQVTATVSNTNVWTSQDVAALYVFGRNNAGNADQTGLSTKLQGYSLGLSMTDTQAAGYYTAMQAFQTALGRQL